MKRVSFFIALLLMAGSSFADQPTTRTGQQIMVAFRTSGPIVLDGVVGFLEWMQAMPLSVNAAHPDMAPGVVPHVPEFPYLSPPDNPADLSFTVRALYDDENLYVAVEVTDDRLIACHSYPFLWQDDDVELMIDGDKQPGDFDMGVYHGVQNSEGFQLIASLGGGTQTEPRGNPKLEGIWKSAVSSHPSGYTAEFQIPLSMVNTEDTSEWSGGTPGKFRPLQAGDVIGFNVAVGDNDTGPGSYLVDSGSQSSSYLAWDGSSLNWSIWREEDWGRLYLAAASGGNRIGPPTFRKP